MPHAPEGLEAACAESDLRGSSPCVWASLWASPCVSFSASSSSDHPISAPPSSSSSLLGRSADSDAGSSLSVVLAPEALASVVVPAWVVGAAASAPLLAASLTPVAAAAPVAVSALVSKMPASAEEIRFICPSFSPGRAARLGHSLADGGKCVLGRFTGPRRARAQESAQQLRHAADASGHRVWWSARSPWPRVDQRA